MTSLDTGCRWKRTQVAEHLKRLVDAGTVEWVSKGVYKVVGRLPETGAAWLPTIEVLA